MRASLSATSTTVWYYVFYGDAEKDRVVAVRGSDSVERFIEVASAVFQQKKPDTLEANNKNLMDPDMQKKLMSETIPPRSKIYYNRRHSAETDVAKAEADRKEEIKAYIAKAEAEAEAPVAAPAPVPAAPAPAATSSSSSSSTSSSSSSSSSSHTISNSSKNRVSSSTSSRSKHGPIDS